MRPFNVVILVIFGFFIVGGVIAVATFTVGNKDEGVAAEAVVWGTLPESIINETIDRFNQVHDDLLVVEYVELSPDRFDSQLAEALAAGTGPDAVILSHAQLLRHENKLFEIPFESYPQRTFRDTFTQGSEIFMTRTGILAFPLLVDPLVMYWNRTLFGNARVANPPRFWDELLDLGSVLTEKDSSFNIIRSVAALGEYRNVTHAKEILATLVMQAGDPIVTRDAGNRPGVVLGGSFGLPEAPADSALRFYTEFANPVKAAYSWNRALPASRDMFIRGDLGLYFGFASELFELQERNPNLNFDVAPVPQIRESTLATTFGTIYAIGVTKQSPNVAGAYQVATILSGADMAGRLVQVLDLAPVRRDLITQVPNDLYRQIFYSEGLIAQGFLDPDPRESERVFQTLVESIVSGRSISGSVNEAQGQLSNLLN